jgi:heme exporter protein A
MTSGADAGGASGASVLQAVGLACERAERLLFEGLSFGVAAGQCLHVAGDNGAGKTSLLRILCGMLAPSAGQVRWRGRPIREARDEYGSDLRYVGHLNGVKDDLTAAENLRMWAAMAAQPQDAAQVSSALQRFAIERFAAVPCGRLSQGQKRRVGLARLLLGRAAGVWILDEPFVALDPGGVATLNALIEQRVRSGGIVVLTTHQAWQAPVEVARLDLAQRPAMGRAA